MLVQEEGAQRMAQRPPMIDSELPPMHWANAGHALAWAEEMVSRPDCPSPTGALISSMKGYQMRGWSSWTAQDFRDLAETVIVCATSIRDPLAQQAFRSVHGVYDQQRSLWVAVELAKVTQGRSVAEGKTYSQVSRIAKVAVFRERTVYEWRKPLGVKYYAGEIGIARQSLDDGGWRPLIRETEEILRAWIERGEMALIGLLEERGLW